MTRWKRALVAVGVAIGTLLGALALLVQWKREPDIDPEAAGEQAEATRRAEMDAQTDEEVAAGSAVAHEHAAHGAESAGVIRSAADRAKRRLRRRLSGGV